MKIEDLVKGVAKKYWGPESEIFYTGFKVFLHSTDNQTIAKPVVTNFGSRVVIYYVGELAYYKDTTSTHFSIGQVRVDGGSSIKSENTGWIIILHEYREQIEWELKKDSYSIAGLSVAINGENMPHELAFHQTIKLYASNSQQASEFFKNPNVIEPSNMARANLDFLDEVIKKVHSHKDSKKLILSLNWFFNGLKYKGVDAILYFWIALEALAMEDTTNIKPINTILAKAYEIPLESAQKQFQIGKMYNLRSEIVHNGLNIAIDAKYLDYFQCVYTDVLLCYLEFVSLKKSELFLKRENNFDVSDLVKK